MPAIWQKGSFLRRKVLKLGNVIGYFRYRLWYNRRVELRTSGETGWKHRAERMNSIVNV
ncbi:hypothetical protein DFQ00_13031 [Paenibacillus barcinonensis]|uniref:Uncharacterized protein n=1 Tax=Paenibacillus barcinonensis TaxID=198119 RepID=A0A2V4UT12_PAEBA|nr:hypothetical protein DFQ00_13031 [Paenibacillus barcinonensis]